MVTQEPGARAMSNTKRVRNVPEANIYRPPAARLSQEQPQEQEAKPSTRQRRPDIQVYVPRPRRFATDTSPQSTCPSPPSSQPQVPTSQAKSSRHRNCSPNTVTPRKKSQKPSSEQTPILSSTTISSESDIFELDDSILSENKRNSIEDSSKYLPYFVKKDILLPNTELDTEKLTNEVDIIQKQEVVEEEKYYLPYFVKSNETYSSTNISDNLLLDDRLTDYIQNHTEKVESEFTKFLKNDHKFKKDDKISENLNKNEIKEENTSTFDDRLTEHLEKTCKNEETAEVDRLSEYLQKNSDSTIQVDRLSEYLQKEEDIKRLESLKNEPTDKLTEYIQSLPNLHENSNNIMLVESSKHVNKDKSKNNVSNTPVLKISSVKNNEETLDKLGRLIQEDCKKVKRTKKISDTSKCSQDSPTSKKSNLNIDECSWDMLFDENGDCLEPSIMDELTKQVGRVKVERPSSDYSAYENAREAMLAETEYPHVLEVYGFPVEFKTQDLMAVLTPLAGRAGLELKWVDDTHALAVFSNSHIAAEVLSYSHPMLKTRPLSQACPESKLKARRSGDFLLPYRARPETCTAMAKRLVSSALGVRLTTSKEEREKERSLLREAREKKRLAAKQSEEAWEGKITSK